MKQQEIIKQVELLIEHYSLANTCRRHDQVFPRYYLMNFLRENTNMNLYAISCLFKKRDHSLVIHAINQHKNYRNDPTYKFHTENVHLRLNNIKPEVTKAEESNIISEVMRCTNYYEMKKLQNKLVNMQPKH